MGQLATIVCTRRVERVVLRSLPVIAMSTVRKRRQTNHSIYVHVCVDVVDLNMLLLLRMTRTVGGAVIGHDVLQARADAILARLHNRQELERKDSTRDGSGAQAADIFTGRRSPYNGITTSPAATRPSSFGSRAAKFSLSHRPFSTSDAGIWRGY